MINKEKIKQATGLSEVIHFDSINSSNTYLKEYGKANPHKDKILVIADTQTEGRGRSHKSFYSPNSGLYFSLLYRYSLSLEDMQLVTIVAAVAVSETLTEDYQLDISIKWLNDIFMKNKKLCGILCEGVLSQSSHYDFIVIGIGINLKTPEDIPEEISDIFIALDQDIDSFDKSDFLIHMINRFESYMNDLRSHQEHLITYYKNKCMTLNRNITVSNHPSSLFAFDISPKGHLIARDHEGVIHTLNSGEVTFKYEN